MKKILIPSAVLILTLSGCGPVVDPTGTVTPAPNTPDTSSNAPQDPSQAPGESGSSSGAPDASRLLEGLTVQPAGSKEGYTRAVFGTAWKDIDGNGCDTRNDILARDLSDIKKSDSCVVVSGVLKNDPYTGKDIVFKRGRNTSSVIQIDHVIAISDAYQKGAKDWNQDKREAFANDPLNLISADGPENASKGDSDASQWLPPKNFQCTYVIRQIEVKAKYDVWITSSEKKTMQDVLSTCDDTQVSTPTQDSLETMPPAPVESAPVPVEDTPAPVETNPEQVVPGNGVEPDYGSCAKAKAAGGKTPYVRDVNPEYSFYRDNDGDGKVCE